MPRFLDPTGHPSYGIGLCARCGIKMYLDELFDDPNYPGLKVCKKHDDIDEYDPYRLPAREPDNIVLEFVRDDTPISTSSPAPLSPGWPPADSESPDGITFVPGT
jgi:hypothetical protein